MQRTHALSLAGAVSLGTMASPAHAITNIDSCRTIAQPGSYRVVANLTANGDCLVLRANHVTIDLQGHALIGNGTGDGIGTGNDQTVEYTGITVRNGVVTTFQEAVDLAFMRGAVVTDIRAVDNGLNGILVGVGSAVSGNVVSDNNGIDIFVAARSINGSDGGTLVADNVVEGNRSSGIIARKGSVVRHNSVRRNQFNGIDATCPSAVIGNATSGNGGGLSGRVNLKLSGTGCMSSQNASAN